MAGVAYQYGNCYWNASGEFECLGADKIVTKTVLEKSIKKTPPQIPLEHQQGFVQPTSNYARVPIDRKNAERHVIEHYEDNQRPQSCGQRYPTNDPGHRKMSHGFNGRSDDLCPLSREMEISVYLPDRDSRFPWDRNELQQGRFVHPQRQDDHQHRQDDHSNQHGSEDFFKIDPNKIKNLPPPVILPPRESHKSLGKKDKHKDKHKIYAPSKSAEGHTKMSPFFVQGPINGGNANLLWNNQSKYFNKFRTKVNKYYFQLPHQKYYELVDEFGQPTLINQNKGGIAIWQGSALKNTDFRAIKRIDLIDEQCFNSFPCPHIGFLYTYVKIIIPTNKIGNILSICGDIMYDPMKHIMVVRGMSLSYNIALIALVCLYINGKLTWYNIIEGNLVKQAIDHKQLTNKKTQKQNMAVINKYLIK